jgi:nucleotide-binding universal stress UspA family protein
VSIRRILVHIDGQDSGQAMQRLAMDLARHCEAEIFGVAAVPVEPPVVVPIEAGAMAAELLGLAEASAETALVALERGFIAAGGSAATCHGFLEHPNTAVAREARGADLIVVARHPPHAKDDGAAGLDLGALLVQAGRPVLVAPPGMSRLSAEKIVVAWKDTREARRAVADALPLLQRAESVLLLATCERGSEDAGQKGAEAVAAWLAAHGVVAAVEAHALREASVRDELVAAAERTGADLIVAGCYGHSRISEWAFGGVTRDLLRHAPLCCLLSH